MDPEQLGMNARRSSLALQSISAKSRDDILLAIHEKLKSEREQILDANRRDLDAARGEVEAGRLSASLLKRLDLGGDKFRALSDGVLDVMRLPDPTGKTTLATELYPGLNLYRVTCAIGVLLVIFEARPEVLIQIASLALKSRNAVILKGGKEARYTLEKLSEIVRSALQSVDGAPIDAVQLILSREQVGPLLKLDKYIDMVIPRGSKQLVQSIQDQSRMPVLGHADGLCSIYVDADADAKKAVEIIVDSKTTYPAACNSVETVLLHRDTVETVLPLLSEALLKKGVQIRIEAHLKRFCAESDLVKIADEGDFRTEFLDLTIALKSVASLSEAIEHINSHGSRHTECIISENEDVANEFIQQVDAAGVYWNASTRFADGYRYGFGAEIGVSTNKTHARGPVGLEGLVIYKYKLVGRGDTMTTGPFSSGEKRFTHRSIDSL